MLVDICVVVQPNGVEHAQSLAVIPEVECLKHPELKSKTEELEARICQHKQSCHGHISVHCTYSIQRVALAHTALHGTRRLVHLVTRRSHE